MLRSKAPGTQECQASVDSQHEMGHLARKRRRRTLIWRNASYKKFLVCGLLCYHCSPMTANDAELTFIRQASAKCAKWRDGEIDHQGAKPKCILCAKATSDFLWLTKLSVFRSSCTGGKASILVASHKTSRQKSERIFLLSVQITMSTL